MSGTRTCLVSDTVKKISEHQWLTTVQENDNDGELYIQLPDELLEKMEWQVDDELEWIKDGVTWAIRKKI